MSFIICYRNSDNRLSNSVKGGVKENYQKKITYEVLPKPQKTISNQTNGLMKSISVKRESGGKNTPWVQKKKKSVCVCMCVRVHAWCVCVHTHARVYTELGRALAVRGFIKIFEIS